MTMDSREGKHKLIANYNYVMGESACTLTVLDVAELLQARFAFISGGKARNGSPIITFPDNPGAPEVSEEEYKSVVSYLTSVPTLQEVDLGFIVVLDRRNDRWGSVKTMLLRISGFFPGLVHEVFVLRPTGFLQRTFTDMGYKFVKDDFKFKVLMCNSVEELHEQIDPQQLTQNLGGTIAYDHKEWIQQRAAIEKFSANTTQIGQSLRELCRKFQETEFPNDQISTEALIQEHENQQREVKDDLTSTIRHGEVLLRCFKSVRGDGEGEPIPSSELSSDKLAHVTAVERLLVQLDETERNFDDFWEHHSRRLYQCLQLRKFEEEFKSLQYMVSKYLEMLDLMTDTGDTLARVELLIKEMEDFEEENAEDLAKAEELRANGEQFMAEDHYAIDCIRPKCIELQRMCEQYKELVRKRYEILQKSRDLQERIDKANKWCTRGVDLLANQQIERCNSVEGAEKALAEVEAFLVTAGDLKLSNPKEFRNLFEGLITPETKTQPDDVDLPDLKTVVTQVLQRIEDVQSMCEKRRNSLKKLVTKPNRPVQPVPPEPVSHQNSHSPQDLDRKRKKGSSQRKNGNNNIEKNGKTKLDIIHADFIEHTPAYRSLSQDSENESTSSREGSNSALNEMDTLNAKRGHVMKELIETERIYVSELQSILEGYASKMDDDYLSNLIPDQLVGRKSTLFGNMEQIYEFHKNIFLEELENCQNTPGLVGRCFMDRKEEFQMYSSYCQNKPRSEALRHEIGDNNPFFKECQKQLNHKLPLGAYLLKPVQRITKYQLLLKEMLKYTQNEVGADELKEALDTILSVLKYVNDIMHQVSITGFNGSLAAQGRLLMQGSFNVWTEHKKDKIKDLRFKPMRRHIFLYEKIVLFCKKKEDLTSPDKATYTFKNSLETARIGLTENVKSDKKKFELWVHGRAEVYIIQAPNKQTKETWVREIKKVLLGQFDMLKETSKKDIPVVPLSNIPEGSTPFASGTRSDNVANNNNPTSPITLTLSSPGEDGSGVGGSGEASDAGWSSDEFSEDDALEDPFVAPINDDPRTQQYMVLADYMALSDGELTMHEGEIIEVLKVGSEGWWFVRGLETNQEGWAPASYLEQLMQKASHSNLSVSSMESGGGSSYNGSRHAVSLDSATGEETVV